MTMPVTRMRSSIGTVPCCGDLRSVGYWRVEEKTPTSSHMIKNRQFRRDSLVSNQAVKARSWISSKQGQSTIRESLARARQTTERLTNARLVSQDGLHEPITR